MATIAMFNEICQRSSTEAIGYAEQSREPKLLWAASLLKAGKWRMPNGVLASLPWNQKELPHTIAAFNQVLQAEGADAACSFAAWSGNEKLMWAAEKLRAGEWDPNGAHASAQQRKLPKQIGKTSRSGGKAASDKRRAERKLRDKERHKQIGGLPRPGEQDAHSRRKKKN